MLNDGSEWCFVCHKFFFQVCKHHNTVVILMQGNKQIEKAPLLEDPVVVKKFSTFCIMSALELICFFLTNFLLSLTLFCLRQNTLYSVSWYWQIMAPIYPNNRWHYMFQQIQKQQSLGRNNWNRHMITIINDCWLRNQWRSPLKKREADKLFLIW